MRYSDTHQIIRFFYKSRQPTTTTPCRLPSRGIRVDKVNRSQRMQNFSPNTFAFFADRVFIFRQGVQCIWLAYLFTGRRRRWRRGRHKFVASFTDISASGCVNITFINLHINLLGSLWQTNPTRVVNSPEEVCCRLCKVFNFLRRKFVRWFFILIIISSWIGWSLNNYFWY